MDFNSPKSKILALVLFVAVLAVFAHFQRPIRSAAQSDFDGWLTQREQAIAHAAAKLSAAQDRSVLSQEYPAIQLDLFDSGQAPERTFRLSPASQELNLHKILRLLQLMREADIFSLSEKLNLPSPMTAPSPVIVITVAHKTAGYRAKFRESDIRGNIQAHLLLKLFQEYAQPIKEAQEHDENPR